MWDWRLGAVWFSLPFDLVWTISVLWKGWIGFWFRGSGSGFEVWGLGLTSSLGALNQNPGCFRHRRALSQRLIRTQNIGAPRLSYTPELTKLYHTPIMSTLNESVMEAALDLGRRRSGSASGLPPPDSSVARRARIWGSWTFSSFTPRLESSKNEGNGSSVSGLWPQVWGFKVEGERLGVQGFVLRWAG